MMFSIVDTIFSFIKLYAQVNRFQVSRLKPGTCLWFLRMEWQVKAEFASTDLEPTSKRGEITYLVQSQPRQRRSSVTIP